MDEKSSTFRGVIEDNNNNDGENIIHHTIRPSVSLDSLLNNDSSSSPYTTTSKISQHENINIMSFSNRGGNTIDHNTNSSSSIFRPILSWATNTLDTSKSHDELPKSHSSPRTSSAGPIHESIIPHYTHHDCPSPTNVNIRHRTHHHYHVNNSNDGTSLHTQSLDDADVAAGSKSLAFCRRSAAAKSQVDNNAMDGSSPSASSMVSSSSSAHHLPSDRHYNQVDVLGVDISHFPRQSH